MMLFIYMKSIIIYVKVSAQVISMLTAIFIIIKYYQHFYKNQIGVLELNLFNNKKKKYWYNASGSLWPLWSAQFTPLL